MVMKLPKDLDIFSIHGYHAVMQPSEPTVYRHSFSWAISFRDGGNQVFTTSVDVNGVAQTIAHAEHSICQPDAPHQRDSQATV